MQRWRVYRDEPTPGIVEVGLERVSARRRLLGSEEVIDERVFGRFFALRDLVAIGG
jgi:hypothetical protein